MTPTSGSQPQRTGSLMLRGEIRLGDLEPARSLLHEVAASQDPSARDEALLLLREIG